jgi:hypothetical protein
VPDIRTSYHLYFFYVLFTAKLIRDEECDTSLPEAEELLTLYPNPPLFLTNMLDGLQTEGLHARNPRCSKI